MRLIYSVLVVFAFSCSNAQNQVPQTQQSYHTDTAQMPILTLNERDIFVYTQEPKLPSHTFRVLGVYGDNNRLYSAIISDGSTLYAPSLIGNTAVGHHAQLLAVDPSGVRLQIQEQSIHVPLAVPNAPTRQKN